MGWLLGLALLTYIIFQLSLDAMAGYVSTLNWWALVLTLFIKLGVRFLSAYKWYVLLLIRDPLLLFRRVLVAHFIGAAAGVVLPMMGGDVTMGYAYYRRSGQAGNAISSILVDRVIGVYILILIAVAGVLLRLDRFLEVKPVLFFIAGAAFGIIVFTCIVGYFLVHPKRWAFLWVPAYCKNILRKMQALVTDYLKQYPGSLALNAHLSFVIHILRVVTVYTLAFGIVGAQVHLIDFVGVVPLIFLFTTLPISPSGLGVQEGVFIFFLGMVGVSTEGAFFLSLLDRGLSLISVLPGTIWLMRSGIWAREAVNVREEA